MSDFAVRVVAIDSVTDHPEADRLSINKVGDLQAITNKHPDGKHRFAAGELAIFVPEGAIVPKYHLVARGYWDPDKDKGLLAGGQGNRVKPSKMRGEVTQGLLWKLDYVPIEGEELNHIVDDGIKWKRVKLGDDLTDWLDISEFKG